MVKADEHGIIHVDAIDKAVDENTKLVTLTHISNAIGSVQPVEEIGKSLRTGDHFILLMLPNQLATLKWMLRN